MSVRQTALVHGDALDVLKALPADSVHASVTSVPYWGQRCYLPGDDREQGRPGQPLHVYLDAMVEVYRAVARVLVDDGIAWLNIGDTAVGSGGAGGDYNPGGPRENRETYRQGPATVRVVDPGTLEGWRLVKLRPGQWADVPGRLAHALQADGWLLRSFVVWRKPQPRREAIGHVKRPKAQHERVMMLTRCEPGASRFAVRDDHPAPERIGDVWGMDEARGLERVGKAPWPYVLPRFMLELSGPPGVALDPFIGSGNTAVGAEAAGWDTLGIDLDVEALRQAPGGIIDAEQAGAWLGQRRMVRHEFEPHEPVIGG